MNQGCSGMLILNRAVAAPLIFLLFFLSLSREDDDLYLTRPDIVTWLGAHKRACMLPLCVLLCMIKYMCLPSYS
jgi:hypothetical protein